MNDPADLRFGPDGSLYVSSFLGNEVLRYDGSSGAFLNVVASGLNGPIGLSFGSDGSLYISNAHADQVLRYNASGLSVFVATGSGGVDMPRHAVFGPDANGDGKADLYVTSYNTSQLLRFSGANGSFIDSFLTLPRPAMWLEMGADGLLYTSIQKNPAEPWHNVDRFNSTTGAFVDTTPTGRGWPFSIGPDGLIYVSGNGEAALVDRLGPASLAAFSVSLNAPSAAAVTVDFATNPGTAGTGDYAATTGTLTFAPGQTTRTILVQATHDTEVETSETFTVNLTNASEAVIADGSGTGTILPPTKFYVVNDGSPDRTFEYGATGVAVENYAINSANTAPRGAASNLTGDKVWVVDANRNVYVYSPSGAPLGSWSAGSIVGNPDVQGIATSGADVWIVDAKGDKVYRYTGAASRLSGSQNAASSFALNTANKDASDLVTDGQNICVLNNTSTTDKVFKYTVTGSLLGSWTITSAGGSPTGITLDPSSPSHLWIVDNSTDSVYQFDAATSRTSGSQSPSTSFALASGNTNPQGLADPPATSSQSAISNPQSSISASHDLALLSLLQDLDSLLPTARRRK